MNCITLKIKHWAGNDGIMNLVQLVDSRQKEIKEEAEELES